MKHDQATKCLHENRRIFKRQRHGEIVDHMNEKVDLDERKCIRITRACPKGVNFPLSEDEVLSDDPPIPLFISSLWKDGV
jgi:hypothetical protein